jgi:hypothetical protein
VPYGKRLTDFPRQCIFIGTTNSPTYLFDPTGGRRFWPVSVTGQGHLIGPPFTMTQDYIDQIWAEAVTRYREGEKLYLDNPELEKEGIKQQEEVRKESEKSGIVAAFLDRLLPIGWEDMDLSARRNWLDGYNLDDGAPDGSIKRERVCVMEIWAECFRNDPGKIKRFEADEIHDIMMTLPGWKRYAGGNGKLRFGRIYGGQRAYVPIDDGVSDLL